MIKKALLSVLMLGIFSGLLIAQNYATGRIVDDKNMPICDASVVLDGPATKVFYSDSSGFFLMPEVLPGSHLIKIHKFGWLGIEKRINVSSTPYNIGTIMLRFGDYNGNGNIDLQDLSLIGDRLDDTVTNSNRFLDIDQNALLNTTELSKAALSVEMKGDRCPEWLISKPDFVTFVPRVSNPDFATNQQYLVTRLNNGRLLGIWTAAYMEGSPNQSMLCHWSDDNGKSWSSYKVIDGPLHDGKIASWGFSIYIPETNRFYVFYNKDIGTRIFHHGRMLMKYSTNDGESWSEPFEYKFDPGEYTPRDSTIPPQWWVYQNPIMIGDRFFVGFTEVLPHEPDVFFSTEIRFLSFENIISEKNPDNFVIKTYPVNGRPGLRGSYLANSNRSTLQEPSIVKLSDGRLFCLMRSGGGSPFFSVSSDTGLSWSIPKKLRFADGSEFIKQPLASCPMYSLGNGQFILIFHNNSGDANGGTGPSDLKKVRTPAYVVFAQESLFSNQPLTFGRPNIFLENYVRPFGPQDRTEIATYPSMTKMGNDYVLWYPDRKHFLLGKILPKPTY